MCIQSSPAISLWPIIPAAGLGTRFLPISKIIPKELLPINSRPAIDFVLQELVDLGVSGITLVNAARKQLLSDYAQQFAANLKVNVVLQAQAKGLGDAVLLAMPTVKMQNALMPVLLPDNIFGATASPLKLLLNAMQSAPNACAAVLLVQAPKEMLSSYGVVAVQEKLAAEQFLLKTIVEKPLLENAPSNLAVMGRYLFSSCIIEKLQNLTPGINGELQLTDAINALLVDGKKVVGVKMPGEYFDVGNPAGWLAANNYFLL